MHRVAVVGTAFGMRIQVPALREAGFEVVALVGQDPEKTARRAERLELAPATSLTEALSLGLDAVVIASPPATHAALATEALEAGCHVLLEKPFTVVVAEAEALAAVAATTDRVAVVGHEFRFAPSQALVGRVLAAGLIGEPRVVLHHSVMGMLRQFRFPAWWYDPSQGGGWLNASGSHRLDALRQWFGEVERVSATFPSTAPEPLGVEDAFSLRLEMAGGISAEILQAASAVGSGTHDTRIIGTEGTIVIDGEEVRLETESGTEVVAVPADLAAAEVAHLVGGSLAEMTRVELVPAIAQARAFAELIAGRTPSAANPATFADGLATTRVIAAARRSGDDGGAWVSLKG